LSDFDDQHSLFNKTQKNSSLRTLSEAESERRWKNAALSSDRNDNTVWTEVQEDNSSGLFQRNPALLIIPTLLFGAVALVITVLIAGLI